MMAATGAPPLLRNPSRFLDFGSGKNGSEEAPYVSISSRAVGRRSSLALGAYHPYLESRRLGCSSSSLFSSKVSCCADVSTPAAVVTAAAAPAVRGGWRKTALNCSSRLMVEEVETAKKESSSSHLDLTTVMKFGGSSVESAARMIEVANVILSFPEERPVIVLSAMGKTTNNLLRAGEAAVSCQPGRTCHIKEFLVVKKLHLDTVAELGIDAKTVSGLLDELEQLLTGIAMIREMTPRTRDFVVSFGERLSTRIFAAYLEKQGVHARQYDAFEIGFTTTDEFTNAEIVDVTYPEVKRRLVSDFRADPAIPVVTGFLGKGQKTCATTTLGRGGSDLTATALGKALGLGEIQVWKDVDGVLTCDPNIHKGAAVVSRLTFEEAAELAYFGAKVLHPESMRPARDGNVRVRVKNSYNPNAPGTLITESRDMRKALLTSIVLKRGITLLDIVSLRMLGQFGFLAKVFSIFEELGISVDVVATSEVSISLTLDPSKLWDRELIDQELERLVKELQKVAAVKLVRKKSIISLIGNVKRSSLILEKVFGVFHASGVNVQMISQGASKVNISVVVDDEEAADCVKSLHRVFFEQGSLLG